MKTLLAGSIALKTQSPNYPLSTKDIDIFTDTRVSHIGCVEFLYSPIIFKYSKFHNGVMVNIQGLYNIKIAASEFPHKRDKHLADMKYIEEHHPDLAIRDDTFLTEQLNFLNNRNEY